MLNLKQFLPPSIKQSLKKSSGLSDLHQRVSELEQQLQALSDCSRVAELEQQLQALAQSISAKHHDLTTSMKPFRATYLGNNRLIAPHPVAHHIFLDSQCLLVSPQVIAQTYELGILNYLKATIRPGMKCLEIGANQGFHTLTMAFLVGDTGRVIAFEPNPETFAHLNDSMVSNGVLSRVILENKAAFDRDGAIEFKRLTRYAAGSHIAFSNNDWTDSLNDGNTISVTAVNIQNYLLNKDFIPDFIKIDAEGAEAFIFRNLLEVLKLNDRVKILMEIIPGSFDIAGGITLFIQEVESLGFSFFAIDLSGTVQKVKGQHVIETHGFADYIFAKELG